MQNNRKINSGIILILILILVTFVIVFRSNVNFSNLGGTQAAIDNYKEDVDYYGQKYNLPTSYLMALIMLECSGKKKIHPRFEKKIFNRLIELRDGKIVKFENLVTKDLKGMTDDEIRNLSKSYGPFQIMGYKTLSMGIGIEDLYGENAIKYGVKWINDDYGDVVREGRFSDAFHIHNTGKPYPDNGVPKTFDPDYVKNGLYYMKYFSNL